MKLYQRVSILFFLICFIITIIIGMKDNENKKGERKMAQEEKKLIQEGNLTEEEQKTLLKLSRDVLLSYIKNSPLPKIEDYKITENLKQQYGVFVTLHKKGDLRGCIGYIEGRCPVYQAVIDNTVNSSTCDPRFIPVQENELKDIDIEISVMTPLKKIKSTDEIVIGKHGLVIRKGGRSGLFLPQVPIEWNWNKQEYLMHLCQKASLPLDAWKEGAELYTFSAQVFGEKEFEEKEKK